MHLEFPTPEQLGSQHIPECPERVIISGKNDASTAAGIIPAATPAIPLSPAGWPVVEGKRRRRVRVAGTTARSVTSVTPAAIISAVVRRRRRGRTNGLSGPAIALRINVAVLPTLIRAAGEATTSPKRSAPCDGPVEQLNSRDGRSGRRFESGRTANVRR